MIDMTLGELLSEADAISAPVVFIGEEDPTQRRIVTNRDGRLREETDDEFRERLKDVPNSSSAGQG